MKRIYLASPHMGDEEIKYIQEAFDTNWVAPLGPNVTGFENELAQYVNVKNATALSSATSAIHLALKVLHIKEGEIVFGSSLTFSASAIVTFSSQMKDRSRLTAGYLGRGV